MSPSLRIDPDPTCSVDHDLFPADSEFCLAVAALRDLGLPDVVFLELYAYEVVERCRELAGEGGTWRIPFWPLTLFEAARIRVHAGRELERMLPVFDAVEVMCHNFVVLERESVRVLGARRFAGRRYGELVHEHARAEGWHVSGPSHLLDVKPFEPTHFTAGAVIVRDGRILLQRRPADARVYPDCWDLPGGHFEDGENAEAALARELLEELGIQVIPSCFYVGVQDDRDPASGRCYRHSTFVVDRFHGEIENREGQHLQWWPVSQAIADERVHRLVRAALAHADARGWLGPT